MAKLMRRGALPVLPPVRCPAAVPVAGVTPARCGVVCGVIANDRQRVDGVDMDPRQLAIAREGGDGDTFLTLAGDPSTIERFCCGDGLPVLDPFEKAGGRDTYTYCPVWQAEKDRIWAGREELSEKPEPELVAHGVSSSIEASDPWAQARRDLDVLAPAER